MDVVNIAEIVNNRFLGRMQLRTYLQKLDEDPISIIIAAVQIKDMMLAEELFETYPVQSVRTAIVLDNPTLLQKIIRIHSPFKHSDYMEILEYLNNTNSPYKSYFVDAEVQPPLEPSVELQHSSLFGKIASWFGWY